MLSASVVTPSLNKSFKFQSDWPYNNSQVYLLSSILEDLKEDEERIFESDDNGFVFTSKVHYPNNKSLVKQNVYMDKDSKIAKVEVVDKDNNVLISMNYEKVEYDKKFDDKYFELNSVIDVNLDKNNNSNNSNDNSAIDNNTDKTNNKVDDNVNSEKEETKVEEKDLNGESDNAINDNNNINNNEGSNNEVKETLSIDDIIYPMYLPDNTYLTSQERIDTSDGERLILTFGGENSFVLVEETISNSDDNLIVPVSGEFDFLSDVIGIISTNSVMWHSNGIEYYMTSDTLETSVLVDIARSISVLPVSK